MTTKKKTNQTKPYILDQVDYTYVSYMHCGSTDRDFRIAFGDVMCSQDPTPAMKPICGIVMSFQTARELASVLISQLNATEKWLTERAEEGKR